MNVCKQMYHRSRGAVSLCLIAHLVGCVACRTTKREETHWVNVKCAICACALVVHSIYRKGSGFEQYNVCTKPRGRRHSTKFLSQTTKFQNKSIYETLKIVITKQRQVTLGKKLKNFNFYRNFVISLCLMVADPFHCIQCTLHRLERTRLTLSLISIPVWCVNFVCFVAAHYFAHSILAVRIKTGKKNDCETSNRNKCCVFMPVYACATS